MALLKTYFRVKSPFFYLKGPFCFYKGCDELIKWYFQRKKVGVTHQITGIWPKKHLQKSKPRKTQFSSLSGLKEFAESGFEAQNVFFWWNLTNPIYSLLFLWPNWSSIGIFGVQYPFFGWLCLLFFISIQNSIDLSKL